ncbi:cyclic-di-AMP-binding protein CbpB [Cytobacillus sp. FSL K6-0129]|uniref:cyclic-di-AMP-binding protein CbpB n=1 Tax=Cytobacillus sp. FSL K6-0129 TaxID=2921421 RepID=UPI0030F4C857
MISLHSEEFLEIDIKDLLIPSERVAHVQIGNNLEHTLLVLTKSGYTAIPVLDPHYKLHGLISTPMIMESILGLQRIEFDQLEEKRVEEFMNHDVPRLNINTSLRNATGLLVDHPFICVEDDERYFEGILTRRSLLVQLQKALHSKKKKD